MALALGEYGKFNYTIKLDKKIEVVEGWGAQKKYCLKANFIDYTQARNVVCAKLWGQMVKSRATKNAKLYDLPNGGAVDGFPIIIMLNGEFHGLYTWNIPKDAWMFGMTDSPTEAIVGADESTALDVAFKGETKLDGNGIELEYAPDEENTEWIVNSLNTMINACINSDGTDLDTVISKYLDLDSVIDYFIFTTLVGGADMITRNYLLATFDGVKWIMSAYDMDSVMGLKWDGKSFFGVNESVSPYLFKNKHRAVELVCNYKKDQVKLRWAQLRNGILSESNITKTFENFVKDIPETAYIEDLKKWVSVPSTGANSIDQILRWLHKRLELVDNRIASIVEAEEPESPNLYNGLSAVWDGGYFINWKATLDKNTLEVSLADATNNYKSTKGVKVKPNTKYIIPNAIATEIFAYNGQGTFTAKLTATTEGSYMTFTTQASTEYVAFSFHIQSYPDYENFYIREAGVSPNLFNGLSSLWGTGYFFNDKGALNIDSLEITIGLASPKYNTSKAVLVEPNTDYVIADAPNTSIVSYNFDGGYDGTLRVQDIEGQKVIHTNKSTGYLVFCFYTPTYSDFDNFYVYKR